MVAIHSVYCASSGINVHFIRRRKTWKRVSAAAGKRVSWSYLSQTYSS
jgi:lipopolysaccharide biosynthesis glycosyltransferase